MRTGHLTERTELERALRLIRRRWPLIVACVVLLAGAAVGFSLLQQKKYTASASLLFRDTQFDQELFGSNFVSPSSVDPAQQQATNIDLVSLPVVASRTAHMLGLAPALVKSEVSISAAGQSTVAQISVTDPNPRGSPMPTHSSMCSSASTPTGRRSLPLNGLYSSSSRS
jgi:uncharacterized protein involved in exopolysaccharide biosynthesis